jgi:hypothetical protein
MFVWFLVFFFYYKYKKETSFLINLFALQRMSLGASLRAGITRFNTVIILKSFATYYQTTFHKAEATAECELILMRFDVLCLHYGNSVLSDFPISDFLWVIKVLQRQCLLLSQVLLVDSGEGFSFFKVFGLQK